MELWEVVYVIECEMFEARARDVEAGRVAAEAEASYLCGEIVCGEMVIW